MERLTDKKVAENLKSNIEGLKRAGLDASIDDLRYIKLAEYENEEDIFLESDRTEKQRYCCKCGARMDGDVG